MHTISVSRSIILVETKQPPRFLIRNTMDGVLQESWAKVERLVFQPAPQPPQLQLTQTWNLLVAKYEQLPTVTSSCHCLWDNQFWVFERRGFFETLTNLLIRVNVQLTMSDIRETYCGQQRTITSQKTRKSILSLNSHFYQELCIDTRQALHMPKRDADATWFLVSMKLSSISTEVSSFPMLKQLH